MRKLAVFVTLLLLSLLVYWRVQGLATPRPESSRGAFVWTIHREPNVAPEPEQTDPVSDRSVPDDMVQMTIRDRAGRHISGVVAYGDKTLDVNGSSLVPKALGSIRVSASGFLPQTASVGTTPVAIVLDQQCLVSGVVGDAASKAAIAGMEVRVTDFASGNLLGRAVTNETGEFTVAGIGEGRVVLAGESIGYVPLCTSLEALAPGVVLDLDRDVRVELHAFPIHVTLCSIDNSTNLGDEVIRGLVTCRFTNRPGTSVPSWHERTVSDKVARIAIASGITHAYSEQCALTSNDEPLDGRVEYSLLGNPVGSMSCRFQRYDDFLDAPAPSVLTLGLQLPTVVVTVECPLELRICQRSGIMFGGIRTQAGSHQYRLPHGTYVVGPQDGHPLLDAREWVAALRVPDQDYVKISPESGFGTLRLTNGGVRADGFVKFSFAGGEMGIPLARLPVSMPASPGTYRLESYTTAADELEKKWSSEVIVQAGLETMVRVGSD